MNKEQQKQHLIDMMQEDEKLGLYDEPKQQEEFCHYSGLPSPAAYSKQEIAFEEVFNEEKKKGVKELIEKFKKK